jgi:hypothetical protein
MMAGEPPRGKMEFLLKELKGHIGSFSNKASWYRRVYFGTSMAALIISAAITVIAGWKHAGPPDPAMQAALADHTSNYVLLLGSSLTVLTGYGFFFAPKNSWLLFAAAVNRMRALRGKIEFMQANPSPPEDEQKRADEFHSELQAILDDTNSGWLDIRKASAPPSTSKEATAAP